MKRFQGNILYREHRVWEVVSAFEVMESKLFFLEMGEQGNNFLDQEM